MPNPCDSLTLKSKICDILENTADPEKIDILKVSNALSDPKISQNDIRQSISFLLISMTNSPQKQEICLELIQYMVSMCKLDVLEILSCDSNIEELKSILKKCESKVFRLDLMDFLDKIYCQNQSNSKYSKLINFIKSNKSRISIDTKTDVLREKETEDADIQKAIKLSLETCPVMTIQSPSVVLENKSEIHDQVPFTATVLFDFDAEEEGEMSIKKGEIITVLEKSNDSWWRGQNKNSIGLFPSNFVKSKNDLNTKFEESYGTQINEDAINRCLNMLVDADPMYPGENESEIKQLEVTCLSMKTEVLNRLEDLKNQNQKYAKLDQEYNDLILSYRELIERSRIMNETNKQYQIPYIHTPNYTTEDMFRVPGPYAPPNYSESNYQFGTNQNKNSFGQ